MLRLKEFKTQINGQNVIVEVHAFGRGGSLSPESIIYRHKGRWISEYERKIRNWNPLGINDLLKITYSGQRLDQLIYKNNPLLAMIPKHQNFLGQLYPLPIEYPIPKGANVDW